MLIPRILPAMVALTLLTGVAPGGDDHFLSLTVAEARSGFTTEIHVGLRDWPKRKAGEWPAPADVWFSASFSDRSTRRPLQWTDGERCPVAVGALRGVERLSGASPRIPLDGSASLGTSVRDGTEYMLDVDASVLDGQSVGPVHLSSNEDTSLAKWADAMLAALKPCWSAEKPVGAL